jgi:hypothetical protein
MIPVAVAVGRSQPSLPSAHPDPTPPPTRRERRPFVACVPEVTPPNPDTAQRRLVERLRSLGIDAPIVEYPAHRTVEEGKLLRGAMVGTFTKNLLLRDRKRRLFLFSVHEDRPLDLKTAHKHVGASGQLSFAPPEQMERRSGSRRGR